MADRKILVMYGWMTDSIIYSLKVHSQWIDVLFDVILSGVFGNRKSKDVPTFCTSAEELPDKGGNEVWHLKLISRD